MIKLHKVNRVKVPQIRKAIYDKHAVNNILNGQKAERFFL